MRAVQQFMGWFTKSIVQNVRIVTNVIQNLPIEILFHVVSGPTFP